MDELVKKWLIKAIHDYKIAKKNLDDEELTDMVCFHCQQCVEKLLKAYLLANGINFGKSHNLGYLIGKCIEIDKDFERFLEDVKELNRYAIDIRYPDDFYIPSIEEAKRAFEIAKAIKKFVLKKLNVKEKDLK